MQWKTSLFIFLLSILAILAGYNYVFQPFSVPAEPITTATPVPTPVANPIQQAIQSMSEQQLVSSVMAVSIDLDASAEEIDQKIAWIVEYKPEMVVVFGSDISADQVAELVAELPAQASPWLVVDHEGGEVQRLNGQGFSVLPSWRDFCSEWWSAYQDDPSSPQVQGAAALLAQSAQELSAAQFNTVLAPVIDLAPRNRGVLGSRVCSDQEQVTQAAAQLYIEAFQKAGILPVLKHFPGIGEVSVDLHTQFGSTTVTTSQAELYQQLLTQNQFLAVMTSHAGVTNQFADIPCSLSPSCVNQVIESFPQALVITDALEMEAAVSYIDTEATVSAQSSSEPLVEVAKLALDAGNDILLFGPSVDIATLSLVHQELGEYIQALPSRDQAVRERLKKLLSYRQYYAVE